MFAIATTTFHTCNTGKLFKRISFVLLVENNRNHFKFSKGYKFAG